MQGRVFTLLQSAAGAMIPLGLLVAVPLAEHLSIQIWFLIAGICITVTGIGALFVPAIMDMDKRLHVQDSGSASADDDLLVSAQAGLRPSA